MLAELSLTEIFNRLDPDSIFPLLVVGVGCLTVVVITSVIAIASTVDSIHRRRTDDQLKRDMLGMGMNADEVARVVEASSPDPESTNPPPQGNVFVQARNTGCSPSRHKPC